MPKFTKITSSHWGAIEVTSDGTSILSVAPFEQDTAPSKISEAVPKAVHHRSRIARPMVRKSWLNGTEANRDETGLDKFTALPWDEALDIAAQEIDRVRQAHGNGAIFGGSYGWASAGRFHHAQGQLKRFLNCAGGYVAGSGSYSAGASHVMIPHIFGVDHDVFTWSWQSTWAEIAGHTDTVVAFGGINPKNSQVNAGGIGDHRVASHLDGLIGKGARICTVSPQANDGPANSQWMCVAPGTDVALMLGLAYVLEVEDLVDRDFMARCTTGADILRAYVLGNGDEPPKTPDWAEERCGVAAAEIVELARRMASGRTLITIAWALQRGVNGEQTYWMASALAALLGQIGLPGGGIGFGFGAVGGVGSDTSLMPGPRLPQGHNPVELSIPVARIADALLHPGEVFDFNGQTRPYPDIRLIYWAGGNPFHHHQDLNRLERAWSKPETIIVNEPWWTATAQRADIVFPVTTSFEREDIGYEKTDAYLFHMPAVIAPVGEARSDHAIFRGLAERLGLTQDFTQGLTEPEWIAQLYAEFSSNMAAHGYDVPSWAELKARNWVKLSVGNQARDTPFAKFRADPSNHPLGTPSGRIELVSDTIAGFGYAGIPGHPVWIQPAPAEIEDHPLYLVSSQPADKLHSQLEAALADVPGARPMSALVHPQAASERNVQDGDVIEIFNHRGSCLARARFCAGLHPDVVSLPTGAWLDFDATGRDQQGNPNVLTRDIGTSPLAQGSTAHSAKVDFRVAPPDPTNDRDPN